MDLLMGFYHFLGYENSLKESFGTIHDSETYDEVIRSTNVLLSASPQAVLQNLAAGGRPVYLQRPDYPHDFLPLFKELNIPVVTDLTQEQLMQTISTALSNNYHLMDKNNTKVIEFIRKTFNL